MSFELIRRCNVDIASQRRYEEANFADTVAVANWCSIAAPSHVAGLLCERAPTREKKLPGR